MKIGKILSVVLDLIVWVLMAVMTFHAEGDTGMIMTAIFVTYCSTRVMHHELERKLK